MAASQVPDLADVLAARQRIAPYLGPTPLYRYPALDAMTGAQVWVKHENHQPVGAFKVRGGVNLVSQERGRATPWCYRRLDRQSWPVGGLRGGLVRCTGGDLHARAGQPGEGRVAAGHGRRGGLSRP